VWAQERRLGVHAEMPGIAARPGRAGTVMMWKALKALAEPTFLYHPLRNAVMRARGRRELACWELEGRPTPPPHVAKHIALRDCALRFHLQIFVETGTHRGDTLEAMRPYFDTLYSIELSAELFAKARRRFRRCHSVRLIHGDSGKVLRSLLTCVNRATLFWLDSHYVEIDESSARGEVDTPIREELSCILDAPDLGHVIVIDDARLFGVDPSYPPLDEVTNLVRSRLPTARISVVDDMIRVTPGHDPA